MSRNDGPFDYFDISEQQALATSPDDTFSHVGSFATVRRDGRASLEQFKLFHVPPGKWRFDVDDSGEYRSDRVSLIATDTLYYLAMLSGKMHLLAGVTPPSGSAPMWFIQKRLQAEEKRKRLSKALDEINAIQRAEDVARTALRTAKKAEFSSVCPEFHSDLDGIQQRQKEMRSQLHHASTQWCEEKNTHTEKMLAVTHTLMRNMASEQDFEILLRANAPDNVSYPRDQLHVYCDVIVKRLRDYAHQYQKTIADFIEVVASYLDEITDVHEKTRESRARQKDKIEFLCSLQAQCVLLLGGFKHVLLSRDSGDDVESTHHTVRHHAFALWQVISDMQDELPEILSARSKLNIRMDITVLDRVMKDPLLDFKVAPCEADPVWSCLHGLLQLEYMARLLLERLPNEPVYAALKGELRHVEITSQRYFSSVLAQWIAGSPTFDLPSQNLLNLLKGPVVLKSAKPALLENLPVIFRTYLSEEHTRVVESNTRLGRYDEVTETGSFTALVTQFREDWRLLTAAPVAAAAPVLLDRTPKLFQQAVAAAPLEKPPVENSRRQGTALAP